MKYLVNTTQNAKTHLMHAMHSLTAWHSAGLCFPAIWRKCDIPFVRGSWEFFSSGCTSIRNGCCHVWQWCHRKPCLGRGLKSQIMGQYDKKWYILFPVGSTRVHMYILKCFWKCFTQENTYCSIEIAGLPTWVRATLTLVEVHEKILSVWEKTEQWISLMDRLSWLVVLFQTWGFPVMSNFTHAQLELLLAFSWGPALPLYPVYDIWPHFALPWDHSLNILIFLLLPFITLVEYLPF